MFRPFTYIYAYIVHAMKLWDVRKLGCKGG